MGGEDNLDVRQAYVHLCTATLVMMVNRGLGRDGTNKQCAFLSKEALLAFILFAAMVPFYTADADDSFPERCTVNAERLADRIAVNKK